MDLEVVETGNGGDLIKNGNDLGLVYSFENFVYLGLFGGNIEADSTDERSPDQQAFDWWANTLIAPNDPSIQFNSKTERALRDTALTSAGRQLIEDAVKADLEFMQPFAEVTVTVSLVGVDRVRIYVRVQEPGNVEEKEFIYIWDAAKEGLIATGQKLYQPNPVLIEEEFIEYEIETYL